MSYSAPDAARIAGITYRQIDYWARTDLIRPANEATGSGTRRGYSYRDLVDLRIVGAMLNAGIYLPAARKVMQVLRAYQHLDFSKLTLVMCEDTVRLCGRDELVEIVCTEQSMLNVLPLGGIIEALDNRLHEDLLVDVAQR